MSWFGGKGRKKEEPLPFVREDPMYAYVTRVSPERVGKRQIAGKVVGDFDEFFTVDQLEELVADVAGGGSYRAKIVDSKDRKKYVMYHAWKIAGAPLEDGEPIGGGIESEEASDKTSNRAVKQIEDRIVELEAKGRLAEAEADLRKRTDEDGPPVETESDDGGLRAEMEQLREEMRQRDVQEKENQKLDVFRGEIRELKSRLESNAGGGALQIQMEAIKAINQSSSEQLKGILSAMDSNRQESMQRTDKIMELMLVKSGGADDMVKGLQDKTNDLFMKLMEAKGNSSDQMLDVMKSTWQTALMIGSGKSLEDAGPTTMADIVKGFTDKVCDIVGDYMKQRGGSITKEELNKQIQGVAQTIVRQIGQRRIASPRSQPSPNPVAGPQEAGVEGGTGKAMDLVVDAFVKDLRDKTNTWMGTAARELPAGIVGQINTFDVFNKPENLPQLMELVQQHASPERLQQAVDAVSNSDTGKELLARLGIVEEPESESEPEPVTTPASASAPAPAPAPASAPASEPAKKSRPKSRSKKPAKE